MSMLKSQVLMKLKAVFLDKDGSVIPDIDYNVSSNKVTLTDGVVEGLQILQSNGYLLVMVSNPTDRENGYFSVEKHHADDEKISRMCSKIGIYLDGFYYCENEKPLPGLIQKAASDMHIELSDSWMIGDVLRDVEAGNRAGCKSILINNGSEKEWKAGEDRMPEFFAKDLSEAAKYIIASANVRDSEKKIIYETKYTTHQA